MSDNDGRCVTEEEFRSIAKQKGGSSVLELVDLQYVGQGDFAGKFENEVLSLRVGEVLSQPIEKEMEAGYWLIHRVE